MKRLVLMAFIGVLSPVGVGHQTKALLPSDGYGAPPEYADIARRWLNGESFPFEKGAWLVEIKELLSMGGDGFIGVYQISEHKLRGANYLDVYHYKMTVTMDDGFEVKIIREPEEHERVLREVLNRYAPDGNPTKRNKTSLRLR